MYPRSSKGLNKETEEAVYFFTTPFHPLDNFSAHTIEIWGKIFPTAEHAYQWNKFASTHPEIAEQIIDAGSPHQVKEISDAHKGEVAPEWYEQRTEVMEEILRTKAMQHEDVKDALRRTQGRMIIENSPVDDFWGSGASGKGKNMVGNIWVKIRDELEQQSLLS